LLQDQRDREEELRPMAGPIITPRLQVLWNHKPQTRLVPRQICRRASFSARNQRKHFHSNFFSYHLPYALSISFYSRMFVTLPVYFSSFFNGGFENVGRGPASTRVAILQAPLGRRPSFLFRSFSFPPENKNTQTISFLPFPSNIVAPQRSQKREHKSPLRDLNAG
jgi:hypothetical protein